MGFGLLNYNLTAAAAGATNSDMTAATDADFSQRNGHYIFTAPFNLLGNMGVGVSLTRGRFQTPTWNAIGEFTLMMANRALQPPSNPQFDYWRSAMPPIPLNEEFQVQWSNNLGAATEIENNGILIATPDWNANLPTGKSALQVRASFTVTPTLNAWSGPQALTFSQSLRGGVYAVVGASVQGTNSVFFRIIFPRYKLYNGIRLRPGLPVQTALGDQLPQQLVPWALALGEWGRFHTFEPPQIEVFGTAANSTAYQVFLWLIFLGESTSLLSSGMGGGM